MAIMPLLARDLSSTPGRRRLMIAICTEIRRGAFIAESVFIVEKAFANSMNGMKGLGRQPDLWISRLDSRTVRRPVLLIVDDETLGLKTLASVFEDQDYELVMAGTGADALRFLETGKADLVLLDVMMPGLDGFEICRRIRSSRPGIADVPILLVTALDDRRSRLVGLEAGADDFISKPIDRAEIRARVRTITRLNRSGRLQEEMDHSQQAMSELREYSRRLDVLREIDRSILMAASAREIAAGVLPLLRMLIPFKHAAIYKRDQRGQSIRLLAEEGNRPLLAAVGDPLTLTDLGMELESASAGYVPLMLEPSKQDALARVSQLLLASAGVGVIMAAPLTLKDRLLGVLLLGAERPMDLTGIHAQIAQEVGAIVSLALAHAELLDNLTRSHGQLESLSHRLLQVREEELRRIARELHDEIGQSLAILNLNLARARKAAETPRSRESLEDCGELVAGVMTKVRGLSLDLHPALLDDFGIVTALRKTCRDAGKPDRSSSPSRCRRVDRPAGPRHGDCLLPRGPGGAYQRDSSCPGQHGEDPPGSPHRAAESLGCGRRGGFRCRGCAGAGGGRGQPGSPGHEGASLAGRGRAPDHFDPGHGLGDQGVFPRYQVGQVIPAGQTLADRFHFLRSSGLPG